MRKRILFLTIFLLSLGVVSSYSQESVLMEVEGISLDMKKSQLIDNWGYPAKRESKKRAEIWFYTNENTPHPTDGILVYFEKGKVKNWRVEDNIYEEMNIWGKDVGTSP